MENNKTESALDLWRRLWKLIFKDLTGTGCHMFWIKKRRRD